MDKIHNSNTIPFPTLTTERLLLRQLTKTDDHAIFKIRSNDIVYKYIAKAPFKKTEEAQAFITKINKGIVNEEHVFWAITLKETKELIGTICLWNFSKERLVAEVGYELHPVYHKKGIMNEALIKVVEFGFVDLKLKSIEAFTHKENKASKTLLLRHGFSLEKNRTDEGFPNNIIYILSK